MQQGPFLVQVSSLMTVADLKNKMEKDWGIPAPFQKWILGRQMAESDDQSLTSFDISQDSMAFLFLVTPQLHSSGAKQMPSIKKHSSKSSDKSSRQTSISPSQQQPTYNNINISSPAATPPSSKKNTPSVPSPAPQKKKRTPASFYPLPVSKNYFRFNNQLFLYISLSLMKFLRSIWPVP